MSAEYMRVYPIPQNKTFVGMDCKTIENRRPHFELNKKYDKITTIKV